MSIFDLGKSNTTHPREDCPTCEGKGYVICHECDGNGCLECNETGKFKCFVCHGFGWIPKYTKLY